MEGNETTDTPNTGAISDLARTINLNVFHIRVMLNTNIPGMEPTPLSFSMLYHPDLERGKFSGKNYTMPYFTYSVKYPIDVLAKKTYSDRVDFFFNKTRFNKILRKNAIDYIEDDDTATDYIKGSEGSEKDDLEMDEQIRQNSDHNIKAMLVLLFPIADEFNNVFASSYDQYILEKPSPELFTTRNIDPTTLLNPQWLPLYNFFKPREYTPPIQEVSYLKKDGSTYVVTGVVWQNDLVNHPVYNDFLSVYYSRVREKLNNKRNVRRLLFDRTGVVKGLLAKYAKYESGQDKTPKNVFEVIIDILIKNSRGAKPSTRTPNVKYEMEDDAQIKINQKEFTKREVIEKVVNYLGVVDDLYKGFEGRMDGNPKPTKPKITEISAKNIDEERLNLIVENIANAYIEYINYNTNAEGGVKLNIRDTSRILSELYNAAIILKSLRLIDEFVKDNIRRLDLNEKNVDGTDKPKLEMDIISTIKTSYPMYFKINEDLAMRVKNVVEPNRRSSNTQLQEYLKELIKPTEEKMNDPYALLDIYNTYIANIKPRIDQEYIDKYMYVGVSTVSGNSTSGKASPDKTSGKDEIAGEMPEVYVYINVVSKDDYEKNPNRACAMDDDRIANNLRQVLYANTMLNGTFPEVNPYRSFKFLKGSEANATNDIINNTNTILENTVSPTTEGTFPIPPVPKIAANGGRRRKSRKYPKHLHKRTRKYRH